MVSRIRAHVRRTPRRRLAVAFSITAVLAGSALAALPAFATSTYYVNDDSTGSGSCASPDYASIAAVFADSGITLVDGDVIAVCPGTYTSDGGAITAALTIEGVNADGSNTGVSSSGVSLLDGQFTIDVAKTIAISNLSIGGTSPAPGSTGMCHAIQHTTPMAGTTTLAISNVSFSYNECSGGPGSGGAAIQSSGGLSLDITDSSFLGNSTLNASGGAIQLTDPIGASIEGSGFTDNLARVSAGSPGPAAGGAIAILSDLSAGPFPVSITDTDFTANGVGGDFDSSPTWSGGLGGAVYAENTELFVSGDSGFSGNIVAWQGGAIWLGGSGSSLDVDADAVTGDCPSFTDNYADNSSGAPAPIAGGAVYASGDVTLNCATFSGNGYYENPDPVYVVETDLGGAIYVDGSLEVRSTHDRDDAVPPVDTEEFVRFFDNNAAEDGGAIYLADSGTGNSGLFGTEYDPEALLFQGNTAGRVGGAVALVDGTEGGSPSFAIYGSAFYANAAGLTDVEGGGGAVYSGEAVELSLVSGWYGWPFEPGATLPDYLYEPTSGWVGAADYGTLGTWPDSGNTAICDAVAAACSNNAGGGAVLVTDASAGDGFDVCYAETYGPTFAWNRTRDTGTNPYLNMGGAIKILPGSTPDSPSARVFCGDFLSNEAAEGGAIYALGDTDVTIGSDGSLFDTLFSDNSANSAGGAIRTTNGKLEIFNGSFDGNVTAAASGGGGAIYAFGLVEATDSSFVGNSTGSVGGAITTSNYATLTRSLFSDNQSGQHGGAVYSNDGVEAVNSTFTANEILGTDGPWSGAAIYAVSDIALTHVTVASQGAGNASYDGSVVYAGGLLSLENSIVDEATGATRCSGDTTDDLGGNVVTANCGGPFGTDPTSVVATSAEIALGVLADNGGRSDTMALGADSAAIDFVAVDGAVQCAALGDDQRGIIRPYTDSSATPCDAGAYESRYTMTTSEVSSDTVAVGEFVDDDVTVDGYFDLSGLFDPEGSVEFSYCYDADTPPVWGDCSATANVIGTAALVPSGISGGFSTVSLSDVSGFSGGWDPAAAGDGDGAGYYLFHAEYVPHADGDAEAPEPNRYDASEDDGTNESFAYDVATEVATTTTTRVSRSEITFGQSVRDVATVVADEGTDDPTGDVEFSYCYDASTWPTWGSCDPTTIGTVTLAGGAVTDDLTSTAQSGLVTPPNAGYYVFHAEYLGDTGFLGSEDDGTNERVHVLPAPTFVDLTSGTYFTTGTTSVGLTAAVSAPAGCLEGRSVTYWQDVNLDGTYDDLQIGGTVTTGPSGVTSPAVPLTVTGGIYEIEERVTATPDGNCLETANTATIVVASSADSANGGGHYVNGGRVNFGFTVQIKTNPKTGTSVVSGQMTWHKQGGYRLKGSVTSSIKVPCSEMNAARTWSAPTGAVCAQISGTASYYRWDAGARRWVLMSTGVGYRMFVVDGGTATVCVKKTCSTTLKPDWFRMDVPSMVISGESTEPIQLKGGGIYLK